MSERKKAETDVSPAPLPHEVYVILARVRLEQIERRLSGELDAPSVLIDQRDALRRFLGQSLDAVHSDA